MSDTEIKNEDPVSLDRVDDGDDEVRDGLSAAPTSTKLYAWLYEDGRRYARLKMKNMKMSR